MGSQRVRHDLVTEEQQATGWTASITISTPTSGFLSTELIPILANPFHVSLFKTTTIFSCMFIGHFLLVLLGSNDIGEIKFYFFFKRCDFNYVINESSNVLIVFQSMFYDFHFMDKKLETLKE